MIGRKPGRRRLCFDPEALASGKEHNSQNSAAGMAAAMGLDILTEENTNTVNCKSWEHLIPKSSSWLKTPAAIIKPAAPPLTISASAIFSCITTVHNLTMPPEASGVR